MSNLKSLVARSNAGLSFGKKSKQRFGLGSFVAASTDQMLMTRGGYGSPQNYYSGPESWWDAPGGGAGGSSSANPYNPVAGVGGNIAQGFYNGIGADPGGRLSNFMNDLSDIGGKILDAAVIAGGAVVEGMQRVTAPVFIFYPEQFDNNNGPSSQSASK